MRPQLSPPRWTPDQFQVDVDCAIAEFWAVRMKEPLDNYMEIFDL